MSKFISGAGVLILISIVLLAYGGGFEHPHDIQDILIRSIINFLAISIAIKIAAKLTKDIALARLWRTTMAIIIFLVIYCLPILILRDAFGKYFEEIMYGVFGAYSVLYILVASPFIPLQKKM